ncbi:hypothetical protein RU01_09685 [Rhodococcus sp. MEB064]|nr:hypothetical protein RU01_09685 [Rhodococcus sp. MEB064]
MTPSNGPRASRIGCASSSPHIGVLPASATAAYEHNDGTHDIVRQTEGALGSPVVETTDALRDHGEATGNTIPGKGKASQATFGAIMALGSYLIDVFLVLEKEGVRKSEASWGELFDTTRDQLAEAERDRG